MYVLSTGFTLSLLDHDPSCMLYCITGFCILSVIAIRVPFSVFIDVLSLKKERKKFPSVESHVNTGKSVSPLEAIGPVKVMDMRVGVLGLDESSFYVIDSGNNQ